MKLSDYKHSVAAAFSKAAATYEHAAFIEQQIALRLIERLQYFALQPKQILDIGCGTGAFTQQLQNLFPNSSIIGLDIAMDMVKFAKNHYTNHFLCADAETLPFASKSFDLIVANCSFMWMKHADNLFAEISRVLVKDGLLFFSTLGPNTLLDLQLPNAWPDIITVGNAITSAHMRNPVIESEQLTIEYEQLQHLLQDLQESGTCQFDSTIKFPALTQKYTANFEVIYGHAWGPTLRQFKDEQGNTYVPIESLMYNN